MKKNAVHSTMNKYQDFQAMIGRYKENLCLVIHTMFVPVVDGVFLEGSEYEKGVE